MNNHIGIGGSSYPLTRENRPPFPIFLQMVGVTNRVDMKYEEQIKDPKWQRKRLEILQRDGFRCQMCGREDKPLHVHHLHYLEGHKIWDYHNSDLITLCEDCHRREHDIGSGRNKDNFLSLYDSINHLRACGVTNYEIHMLLECANVRLAGNPSAIIDIVGDMAWLDEDSELYFKNLRKHRKNLYPGL